MRGLGLATLVAVGIILAACGDDGPADKRAVLKLDPIPHVAWLSRKLPESTVGYVRLPMLWDGWLRPRGNALNNVQASAAHVAQIEAIRQGMADNIWSQLPANVQVPLTLAFNQIESPLEVAFLLPPDGSLVPNFLLGTTIKLAPDQSFAEFIDALANSSPQVRVLTPLDERGYVTLFGGPLPLYMHFAADTGRLLILSGTSATQNFLEQTVTAPEASNRLTNLEQKIDTSGRGLSAWMDIATIWPMLRTMIPAEQLVPLELAGLGQLKTVWLGSVARAGHGQTRLRLEMPATSGFRKLLPTPTSASSVTTRGAPKFVFRLALPSRQELTDAADFVLALMPDGEQMRQERDKVLAEFRDWMGVDAAAILDGWGPEILLVSDEAGMWAAYQIRDREAADEVSNALIAKAGSEPTSRRIEGETYYRWMLPSLMSMSDEWRDATALTDIPPVVRGLLERLGSHIYWVEEGDYQIAASVPQILMARAAGPQTGEAGDWLQRSMGIDPANSVVLLAARHDRGARDGYHYYLNMLHFLADVAGASIDPFALPPWDQAGLPEGGGVALGLQSSGDALSLHLNYQYSPVEMLLGADTLTGVAVLGIVAAIAVPAYQDYETRAEVANALGELAVAKMVVAEHWASAGEFPLPDQVYQVLEETEATELDYDSDTGAITLQFVQGSSAAVENGYVQLTPDTDGALLEWICSSDLDNKHLPQECRD